MKIKYSLLIVTCLLVILNRHQIECVNTDDYDGDTEDDTVIDGQTLDEDQTHSSGHQPNGNDEANFEDFQVTIKSDANNKQPVEPEQDVRVNSVVPSSAGNDDNDSNNVVEEDDSIDDIDVGTSEEIDSDGEADDQNESNEQDDTAQTTLEPRYNMNQLKSAKLIDIISKPGILAGIIGACIIIILTAILIVMFIVYRMRKKDEGSYALEDSKKPLSSYEYRNVPTKEFYA